MYMYIVIVLWKDCTFIVYCEKCILLLFLWCKERSSKDWCQKNYTCPWQKHCIAKKYLKCHIHVQVFTNSNFKCKYKTLHCKKNIGGVISKCSHYKSKLGHVWIFMKLCVLFKIVTTTTVAKGDNGWWFFSRSDPKAEVGKGRLGGGEWGKKPCLSGNVGQVGNPP